LHASVVCSGGVPHVPLIVWLLPLPSRAGSVNVHASPDFALAQASIASCGGA
jgi:hypothetical protein